MCVYERGYAPRKFFRERGMGPEQKAKEAAAVVLVVRRSPVVVWVQSWLYVGVIVGSARLALLAQGSARDGLVCGAGQEGSTAEASCQSSQKYAPLTSPAGKSRAHSSPPPLLPSETFSFAPHLAPPFPFLSYSHTVAFLPGALPMDLPSDLTGTLNCRGGVHSSSAPSIQSLSSLSVVHVFTRSHVKGNLDSQQNSLNFTVFDSVLFSVRQVIRGGATGRVQHGEKRKRTTTN